MLTATYKKKNLKISHVWFKDAGEKLPDIKTDLFFIHGTPDAPEDALPMIVSPQKTLVTSLSGEEDITSRFSRETRRHLRKAQNDAITTSVFESKDLLNEDDIILEFGRCYERMFEHKDRKVRFNYDVVKAYINANMLTITTANYGGKNVVFHSCIVSPGYVRILHSVSNFREENLDANLIGRANRLLHYQDIIYFKNKGVAYYDWGGITNFDEPNGIDRFKLGFGGEQKVYLNIIMGKSAIGKSAVLIKKFLNQNRS